MDKTVELQGDFLDWSPPKFSKFESLYNLWHLEKFPTSQHGILYLKDLVGLQSKKSPCSWLRVRYQRGLPHLVLDATHIIYFDVPTMQQKSYFGENLAVSYFISRYAQALCLSIFRMNHAMHCFAGFYRRTAWMLKQTGSQLDYCQF